MSTQIRKTDHSAVIAVLRSGFSNEDELAADLLELHDLTGISLDKWISATDFVVKQVREATGYSEWAIQLNGV